MGGSDSLCEGSDSLCEWTDSLCEGTDSLSEGSDSLSEGSDSLCEGSDSLCEGSDSLCEWTDSFRSHDPLIIPLYRTEEQRFYQTLYILVNSHYPRQVLSGSDLMTFKLNI